MKTRRIIGVLAVVLCLTLSAAALAATSAPKTPVKPNPKPATPKPTPPDNSAVVSARKEAEANVTEYNKAKAALDGVVAPLRATFEKSDSYKAALQAVQDAQTALDAAKAPVFEALKNQPNYIAAKDAKDKAVQAQASLGEAATADDRLATANAVMQAGNQVSKIEGDAFAAEPKVKEAQAKLEAATAALSKLNQDFDDSLKTNTQFTTARTVAIDARKKLEQSDIALKSAEQKHQQALADYDQKLAAWNKANKGKTAGG